MTTPSAAPATDRLLRLAEAIRHSPHNLVSQRAKAELWDRHIMESRALAAAIPGPGRLLDVGSGGGLPGMVIAIERADLQVVLLDSNKKKTEFLAATAAALDLHVVVVRGRAEDLQDGPLQGAFDVVTARAVAPLERLLGWTMPFLAPGGLLYAVKGARWQAELEAAAPGLRTWGGSVVATPDEDPEQDGPRVVVVRRSGPGAAA